MSLYLAIEGVDGAGKSTVCRELADALAAEGRRVRVVREPGGTEVGEEIRQVLLHGHDMTPWAEALLFAAQRAQLAAEVVSPALDRGEVVISDRSYYSSLAYQGGARGLGIEAVRTVNELALGGVIPDLVVVLWTDPEEALARQNVVDRIGGEGAQFQREVAAVYERVAAENPDRVVLVDASRPVDQIVEEIMELIR